MQELLARCNLESLWKVAAEHETSPQLARTLSASPFDAILRVEIAEQARLVRLQTAFYNLAVHAELKTIAGLMQEKAIPVVPLKGTHLAERLYDSLDARRVGDMDILVPEDRLENARAILRGMGYDTVETEHGRDHPFHGAPFVRAAGPAGRFVVELHWKLSDPRFLSVDYPRLWDRVAAYSEGPLCPLPSEETLVFLAVHLCKTASGVLRLLADIDRLIGREGPTMDWDLVVKLAESWSAAWQLYAALYRSEQLLGTELPSGLMDRLRPPGWRRAVIELLAGSEAVLRPPVSPDLRYNEFMLAYSAAVNPMSRSFDAFLHYLFPHPSQERSSGIAAILERPQRAAHGVGSTGVALGHALFRRFSPARAA